MTIQPGIANEQQGTFSTTMLAVAIVLEYHGHQVVDMKTDDHFENKKRGNRYRFVFNLSDELLEVIDLYSKKQLQVEPSFFMACYQELKGKIYEFEQKSLHGVPRPRWNNNHP